MSKFIVRFMLVVLSWCASTAWPADGPARRTDQTHPNIEFSISGLSGTPAKGAATQPVSDVVKIVVGLTVLSLLPAFVVSMTAFIRIAIVLSMLRHAIGMPETPPNVVLVSLALFLTLFVMQPTITTAYQEAWQPFTENKIDVDQAMSKAAVPLKQFMLRNTRPADISMIYEIANRPQPSSDAEVDLFELIPAFIINELRAAFQIGFVIFLPFLVIDLVISSVLLALGMLMVPPSSIALPIKILMFVLIDGWSLVLRGVIGSFK